jgi:cardiolipin synthase A/B
MSNVTEWKFLTSTEKAWDGMKEGFARASKTIDLEQFVFGDEGPIMEEVGALLEKKAAEGVRVRLLLDAVGSFSFYRSALRPRLEEKGVEIVFHRTILPQSFKRLVPAFLRDHRKLIVIDGVEAHIGGVIIQERARTWRDTNVVLHGSIVEDCQNLFNDVWEQSRDMKPIGRVLTNGGNGEFYLVGNAYRKRDKTLYSSMIRAIAEAKRHVYITNPYFALTHELRRAILYAREKGVDITLILPRRSDNLLSDCIGRFYYGELLRAGVRIFHYTKSILHAKTMSVDGSWATVGSCNLDWLSILLNYELNLVTTNPEFTSELEDIFIKDLLECEEVVDEGKWYGFFA